MLLMLDAWNQRELTIIKVLVRSQIILVECFFNTAHVTIHFESILYLQLLIEHVFIPLLHLLFVLVEILIHFAILLSLQSRLILIESGGVIESLDMTLLLNLHLKLLVVQLPCLLLLALYEFFFLVVAIPHLLVFFNFSLHPLSHLYSVGTRYLLSVLILHPPLLLFNASLPIFLLIVVVSNSTKTFVVVLDFINLLLPMGHLLLQVDGLLQLVVNHIPLPLFALALRFQVHVIISLVFLNNMPINILHFFQSFILALVIIFDYLLEVIVQV